MSDLMTLTSSLATISRLNKRFTSEKLEEFKNKLICDLIIWIFKKDMQKLRKIYAS